METGNTRRDFLRRGLLGILAGGISSGDAVAASASSVSNRKGPVDRRRLGRIGADVSILGLGLGGSYMRAFDDDLDAAHSVLEVALNFGINYWDTARSYGPSEGMIAAVLARHRNRVFLASKTDARGYDGFKRDLDRSLQVLRTDYIDLYHLHDMQPRKDRDLRAIEKGAIRAAREARDQKVIRAFGVTGHSGAGILIDCMKQFDPDAVLTIFPCTRPDRGRYEDELLPLAHQRNMGVIAMKTIRYARETDLPSRELLRYSLSLPGVTTAIVGLDSLSHLQENAAVASNFEPLNAARRTELRESSQRLLAGQPPPWENPAYVDGCVA